MREAFFFGPRDQQLFAIYHPAAANSGDQVLTVICPPLFSDYMRTQPALRELASALAEKGQHVLRFDYRGTGDSFGELGEIAVSDWLEDIELAVREGCEVSGSKTVRVLAVRAGALLACRSVGATANVQRLAIWDPIPDGASYLQTLRRNQEALSERNPYLTRAERREARHECAGYTLSARMLEEFPLLDAGIYSGVPKGKLHVVSTSSAASFPAPDVPREVSPFACDWDTLADKMILPRPVLERLIACLTSP